jgi:hypothetical protein
MGLEGVAEIAAWRTQSDMHRTVTAFVRLANIRIMPDALPGESIQRESQLPGSSLTLPDGLGAPQQHP